MPLINETAVAGASYQLAPRAQIFRRDVHAVDDMDSLKALLRSNNWPQEPVSVPGCTLVWCMGTWLLTTRHFQVVLAQHYVPSTPA